MVSHIKKEMTLSIFYHLSIICFFLIFFLSLLLFFRPPDNYLIWIVTLFLLFLGSFFLPLPLSSLFSLPIHDHQPNNNNQIYYYIIYYYIIIIIISIITLLLLLYYLLLHSYHYNSSLIPDEIVAQEYENGREVYSVGFANDFRVKYSPPLSFFFSPYFLF